MTLFHIPFLPEEDYHEFWRLLRPHMPSHYEDWVSSYWQKVQNLRTSGHSITKVDVRADEFVRYCRFREKDYAPQALTDFAAEKAQGHGF